ncbi:MAG: hypothetical protein NVV66_16325 [Cellulomonas sp.]|uniref:hypothetical protein n=1 Tax=Cellulomonas sp. TaxID=40001 RepID=UPI0025858495|nr:hypothetical protein [Cellulomonas sp.]MCR6706183.1 hypothetical protein [Cellulomonas sp.]
MSSILGPVVEPRRVETVPPSAHQVARCMVRHSGAVAVLVVATGWSPQVAAAVLLTCLDPAGGRNGMAERADLLRCADELAAIASAGGDLTCLLDDAGPRRAVV